MSPHCLFHRHMTHSLFRITLVIATVMAMVAFSPPQVAQATTWTVCASGCNFTQHYGCHC